MVTLSAGIMAVGTSLGAALVFQLPGSSSSSGSSSGPTAAAAGGSSSSSAGGGGGHGPGVHHGHHGSGSQGLGGVGADGGGGAAGGGPGAAAGGGGGPIVVVGDARTEAEAVTALALSTVSGPGAAGGLGVRGLGVVFVAGGPGCRNPRCVASPSPNPLLLGSFFPCSPSHHLTPSPTNASALTKPARPPPARCPCPPAADPLWLLVGHASGTVAVWDLQRRPPKQVAAITGQHNLPVSKVAFTPAAAPL